MIRILCVDDDPLVGEYLNARLSREADFELADVTSDASDVLTRVQKEQIDVLVLDQLMPDGTSGTQILQAIQLWREANRRSDAEPAVLFCTGASDEEFEKRARELGARGVVQKDRAVTDLVPAVRAIAEGGYWFENGHYGAPVRPRPRRWRVLVAENDRGSRASLEEILNGIGCTASFSRTGEEVLDSLDKESFDLLLIDSRLPGSMPGVVVLERVAERWPDLPALFTSSQPGSLEHYRPCANVLGVIAKPYSLPQVWKQVASALGWAGGRAEAAAP